MTIMLDDPFGPPRPPLHPPFLHLLLLPSPSLSFSPFRLFTSRYVAELATARSIRSRAYWSSHSRGYNVGDRREATVGFCVIFFSFLLYLHDALSSYRRMFVTPTFTRSLFSLSRVRAREDTSESYTMTNDLSWNKSPVLRDLSLDKSLPGYFWNYCSLYRALEPRVAAATNVTRYRESERASERFNFMSREVILFSRSRARYLQGSYFLPLRYLFFCCSLRRDAFSSRWLRSRCPLTKCCSGRFARDVISRCIIYRDVFCRCQRPTCNIGRLCICVCACVSMNAHFTH